MYSNIRALASYAEKCGVRSILETKPANFCKINLKELNVIATDTFSPAIGKHKIPRYLYHFTTEKNYISMLKEGKLRTGNGIFDPLQGVCMTELSNLLKRWKVLKESDGVNIGNKLIDQVTKGEDNIVALRIPTEGIKKEKLIIRSQNMTFSAHKKEGFNDAYLNWLLEGRIPSGELSHLYKGDYAQKSKLYKQKKKAIEYIYSHNIDISKVERIGDVKISTVEKQSIKELFLKLFANSPEENAVSRMKD